MGSSTARRSSPVIAITGTSGAGKGTLEQELMRRLPELELAVSATTRERRPSERDGREYHFVSEEEFERLVQEGAFLEHVTHSWGPRRRYRSKCCFQSPPHCPSPVLRPSRHAGLR